MRLPLLLIALLWMGSSSYLLSQEPGPITYEMSLAQYSDTYGKTPEYVFIVGDVAYRSVEALKKGVASFPKGSTLKWRPGCCKVGEGEPLLSSPSDMEAFRKHCAAHGVKFILYPSG